MQLSLIHISVGFANKQYDETDYAQEFSKHIGVKNYAYRITPEEYWANLGKIQYLSLIHI